ncbi:MAG TPA: sulfatase [Blastocatellia bacterium]|nr:sulfatase [Blastocatellia bacterium]
MIKATSVFLVTALFISSCGKDLSASARRSAPAEKVNVLLIVADDLNTSLGCYADPVVKSPNIDRLARRGVKFDRAYSQFSLCNPSRSSFLSGLRPDTTGVVRNKTNPRERIRDIVFLPEYFRANGYFTAGVGKIAHDKFPNSITWDSFEGKKQLGLPPDRPCAGKDVCQSVARDEDLHDGRVAERVVDLLKQNQGRAFFIAAGFALPHSPWHAPKRFFDLYPPKDMPLPHGFAGDKRARKEVQHARAAYYASVSFIDSQVGLILKAVEDLNLFRNTVIVFLSDHGFLLGEHGGVVDKKLLYEGVARVPLILAGPGLPQETASPRIVELVDIFPTLGELCRLPAREGLEGISLAPLFQDPNRPWKTAAFTQTIKSKKSPLYHSVRTERYAYFEQENGTEPELYDHLGDPHEVTNLASSPEHAAVVAQLRRLLQLGWTAALPPSSQ